MIGRTRQGSIRLKKIATAPTFVAACEQSVGPRRCGMASECSQWSHRGVHQLTAPPRPHPIRDSTSANHVRESRRDDNPGASVCLGLPQGLATGEAGEQHRSPRSGSVARVVGRPHQPTNTAGSPRVTHEVSFARPCITSAFGDRAEGRGISDANDTGHQRRKGRTGPDGRPQGPLACGGRQKCACGSTHEQPATGS